MSLPSAAASGVLCMLEEDDAALKVRGPARGSARPLPFAPEPAAASATRAALPATPSPQSFALRKLDAIVDESWSEAASMASMIEELSEDKAFADHKLAARVASKVSALWRGRARVRAAPGVPRAYRHWPSGGGAGGGRVAVVGGPRRAAARGWLAQGGGCAPGDPSPLASLAPSGPPSMCAQIFYHLEAYPEALHLALESAELFDINERSEYSEKMIGQCIDEYTRARNEAAKNPDHGGPDPRMEAIVMRMFERCFTDGAWSQAVGIAVEARRLDVVEDAVSRAGRSTRAAKAILADAYDAALRFVSTREYRTSVFELLRTVSRRPAACPARPRPPSRPPSGMLPSPLRRCGPSGRRPGYDSQCRFLRLRVRPLPPCAPWLTCSRRGPSLVPTVPAL